MGVFVIEDVVFRGSVVAAVTPIRGARFFLFGSVARVDEDGDSDRHLASVDQVIEDIGNSVFPFRTYKGLAILKDHEPGGFGAVVLGRDVNPVMAGGIREDLARQGKRTDDFAVGNIVVREGIGSQSVDVIERRSVDKSADEESDEQAGCLKHISEERKLFHDWNAVNFLNGRPVYKQQLFKVVLEEMLENRKKLPLCFNK
ncbi:MAG: hypothetical protein JWM04_1591 [Verrucomicrobiales bacterium]|nr:hypothetical protein [Verrucomicrobiales bacterium]